MKIIFFGSDDFALVSLEALHNSGHEIVCCVTQPDKPQGRGLKLESTVIKDFALKHKISCLQPVSLKTPEIMQQLKSFNCDLFAVIAYGKILPAEVLQAPYICAMNVHGSLLPKYRGAAPINWAIVNGEQETGVSIIKMNAQMDAGDIFVQSKIRIEPEDTAITLRAKMAALGAELLVKTINTLEKNEYTLTVQDFRKMTLAPKLTRELGKINWGRNAGEIHNLIRGLLPWPAAYTLCDQKTIKILSSRVVLQDCAGKQPGEVLKIAEEGVLVATGQNALLIASCHPESSKVMDAKSFAAGYKITPGFCFTS